MYTLHSPRLCPALVKDRCKMSKDDYIRAYYQQIKDGTVNVGRWIRLIYELIVTGLDEGRFAFDKKAANSAIEWIETKCFHCEGRLAPGRFVLELWQKAFVSCVFGIKDDKGCRQFREVFLVVGRKNGKSLLAAAIARYIWLVEGGYGARVYCLAPKFDQADIIYNSIWQMTTLDPEWQALKEEIEASRQGHQKGMSMEDLAKKRVSDLYWPKKNSSVKKISFNNKTNDGFNPSLAICDEVAAWAGDKGIKVYEVMKSGMGARENGLLLSCTTSGYVNDGAFDELMKRSTRFLLGDSKETRLLPILYMIDDLDKWNDINELYKANPNLGVSISTSYMCEEIAIAEGSLSRKAEFICKMCNVKQNSSLAWLPAQAVDAISGEAIDIGQLRGSYCVAGIDLSQTTDLTAAVAVIEKNGILNVIAHFWLPAEKIDDATQRDGVPYWAYVKRGLLSLSGDNFVDYHDCENWMNDLLRVHELYPLKTGYDRYSAQYLVKDLDGAGFQMDDVYQGDNLWPVLQELEGLIKDKKIYIGDNDLLKAHLLNSAIKMNAERGRGRLIKINPSAHIDGTAALLDAMCVRQKWYGEIGYQLMNE